MSEMERLTARAHDLTSSIAHWNNGYMILVALTVLLAGGVFVTQFVASRRSKLLADVQELIIKEKDRIAGVDSAAKDERIADALKQAGESNKAAALANERAGIASEKAAALEVEALSLRMDLLRQGARENLLVGKSREKLIASLKPFAGQSIEVRYGLNTFGMLQRVPEPASPDVRGLAESLIAVFTEARWSIPQAPLVSVLQGPDGITVQISPKASPSTVTAAEALVKALKDVPLTAQGPIPTELSAMPRQGTVRLFMPATLGGPAVLTPLPDPTDETIVLSVLAHPK